MAAERTAIIRANVGTWAWNHDQGLPSEITPAVMDDVRWLLSEIDAAHERIALLRAEVSDLEVIAGIRQVAS